MVCLAKFAARVVDKSDISYLARVQARQVKVCAVRRERGTFHLRIYKNETRVSSRLADVLGDGLPSRYSRDLPPLGTYLREKTLEMGFFGSREPMLGRQGSSLR